LKDDNIREGRELLLVAPTGSSTTDGSKPVVPAKGESTKVGQNEKEAFENLKKILLGKVSNDKTFESKKFQIQEEINNNKTKTISDLEKIQSKYAIY
jgi:hypothetical protein